MKSGHGYRSIDCAAASVRCDLARTNRHGIASHIMISANRVALVAWCPSSSAPVAGPGYGRPSRTTHPNEARRKHPQASSDGALIREPVDAPATSIIVLDGAACAPILLL